ncbi:hypothetical protein EJ110_NYTH39987 [Nymphaea thermarum]|nr:hypothetical protein EJ110_NYTH39987 [Nymphaea thermarum]
MAEEMTPKVNVAFDTNKNTKSENLPFQGLIILAFNKGKFNSKSLNELLSLGPTLVIMKFLGVSLPVLLGTLLRCFLMPFRRQGVGHDFTSPVSFNHVGVRDIVMMYGAYSTTRRLAVMRIVLRFLWFGVASAFVSYLYTYIFVLIAYASVQLAFSILMGIPACRWLANRCDQWPVMRFIK